MDVETTIFLYEASSAKNKTEYYLVSWLLRELVDAHLRFDNFTMRGSKLQIAYTGMRTALGISFVTNSTIEALNFYIGDNFTDTIK